MLPHKTEQLYLYNILIILSSAADDKNMSLTFKVMSSS